MVYIEFLTHSYYNANYVKNTCPRSYIYTQISVRPMSTYINTYLNPIVADQPILQSYCLAQGSGTLINDEKTDIYNSSFIPYAKYSTLCDEALLMVCRLSNIPRVV